MPIYEYYCKECNVIFDFMSTKVAPDIAPDCPRCGHVKLTKYLSTFSSPSTGETASSEVDEKRVENAFNALLQGAQRGPEDGSHMSALMRTFAKDCGLEYTDALEKNLEKVSVGGKVQECDISSDVQLTTVSGKEPKGEKKRYSDMIESAIAPRKDEKIYQL